MLASAGLVSLSSAWPQVSINEEFTLPKLDFDYKALEPHIDSATMEIHHSKHHASYVKKLNEALQGSPYKNKGLSIEALLQKLPAEETAIRNNGGGHYNHSLFWKLLSPTPSEPSTEFLAALKNQFGSLETFQEQFQKAALSHFGSGWVWLVLSKGRLEILSTANQDNPLMEKILGRKKLKPILALDVWEHAYYLKYQNKRVDYVSVFWKVLNWQEASRLYIQK